MGISAGLSILLFLWMAFTTPVKKNDTRYPFLMISLTPALLICMGYMGYCGIRSQATHLEEVNIQVLKLSKTGPNTAALKMPANAMARNLFQAELAAFDETRVEFGFEPAAYDYRVQRYERPTNKQHFGVAIERAFTHDIYDLTKLGHYTFTAWITNRRRDSPERYFDAAKAHWPGELQKEFVRRFEENLKKGQDLHHGSAP